MSETKLKMTDRINCSRCHREFQVKDFYKDKNGNPMKKCKKCMASMIDLNSYSTVLPVLKEINIPYIPYEFERLKERYMYSEKDGVMVRNPNCNQTILGKYIGKMKLSQYKDFTYEDTKEFIQEHEDKMIGIQNEAKKELEELMSSGLGLQEALAKMLVKEGADSIELLNKELDIIKEEEEVEEEKPLMGPNEIKELRIKWGDTFSPEELIRLETFYMEMHDSYDITTASHEDYLKKIVKISLRMDQSIEEGDYEAVTKLSNQYDKFMKSAKFTASQKKEDTAFINTFSEMSLLVEEQGFIPIFHTDEPQDIVDVTLRDLNNYTKNLIEKEPGLANLIENAFKAIKEEEEKDRITETDEDEDLFEKDFISDSDFFKDIEKELEDKWEDEDIDE